jgi:putative transposase
VVWIPQYRKKNLYSKIAKYLGGTFHELAWRRESRIVEGHIRSHPYTYRDTAKIRCSPVIGYINGADTLLSFTAFRQHCDFITQIEEYKNKQTSNSSFLNKRNKSSNIKFYYLMEADFVCYIKSLLLVEMW